MLSRICSEKWGLGSEIHPITLTMKEVKGFSQSHKSEGGRMKFEIILKIFFTPNLFTIRNQYVYTFSSFQ